MALLHQLGAGAGPAQLVVMRGEPSAFGPPLDHADVADLIGGRSTSAD
ncbi:MAG: hypothetical protein R2701_12535 [Acidimicrobiales bacterium]